MDEQVVLPGVTVVDGDLEAQARRHLWMPLTVLPELEHRGGPLVFVRGQGCFLFDRKGRPYLDALSGAWVVNVGHGRREIAAAIADQLAKLEYVLSEEGYANEPAIRLATRLSRLAPGTLDRALFTTGGSESVESALKFARHFHLVRRKQVRYKVISRRLSYHGMTYFAMTVTGFEALSQPYGPVVPGSKKIPQPYCYRCDYGLRYPDCMLRCARELDEVILREKPETIAAVIAEPVSASAGVAVPPDGYWKVLREVCDRYEILLIADEVITGFGRTGKMFACEHWRIVPDMMTLAKGLTSGYIPLGALLARQEIASEFDRVGLTHGFTFGAHPVACAAALANLDIIESEGLVENSARMGAYLLEQMRSRLIGHPYVGDIRGLGLLAAVELVEEPETRRPVAPQKQLAPRLKEWFLAHGLYCRVVGSTIQLGPPLCITKAEVDEIVNIVSDGVEACRAWL